MWNKVQLFIWKPFEPILQRHCRWRRLRRRKRRRHEWRRFRLFRVNVHDMIWQHRIQFLVWFVNKDENLRHKLALNIFNVFNFVGCFLSFKNHLPTWTARKSFFLHNRLGLIYIIYQLCNYAISSMLLTYLSFISKQSVVEVSHQIKSGEKCWVHLQVFRNSSWLVVMTSDGICGCKYTSPGRKWADQTCETKTIPKEALKTNCQPWTCLSCWKCGI